MGLVFFASGSANAGLLYDTNLIVNPGADTGGAAAEKNNTVLAVAGWAGTGGFTAVQYRQNCTQDCWPGLPYLNDPGPSNRGVNLFSGGPTTFTSSVGDQTLDISNAAAAVDTGKVPFTLSGWLGGYFDQRDNATFSAILESAAGQVLGQTTIGPVSLADRANAQGQNFTGLLFRSADGIIPAGTRQIDFRLTMNGIDGAQNDGYADSLSFVARDPLATPEPASLGMLGAGLVALGALARRKRGAVD